MNIVIKNEMFIFIPFNSLASLSFRGNGNVTPFLLSFHAVLMINHVEVECLRKMPEVDKKKSVDTNSGYDAFSPYLKGLEGCTLACPMAWSLWAVVPHIMTLLMSQDRKQCRHFESHRKEQAVFYVMLWSSCCIQCSASLKSVLVLFNLHFIIWGAPQECKCEGCGEISKLEGGPL